MGKKTTLSAWCLVPRKIVRSFVSYAEYNPDNKTLTAFLKSVEKSAINNDKNKKEKSVKQGQKRKSKQTESEDVHSGKNNKGNAPRKKKSKTERVIEQESEGEDDEREEDNTKSISVNTATSSVADEGKAEPDQSGSDTSSIRSDFSDRSSTSESD